MNFHEALLITYIIEALLFIVGIVAIGFIFYNGTHLLALELYEKRLEKLKELKKVTNGYFSPLIDSIITEFKIYGRNLDLKKVSPHKTFFLLREIKKIEKEITLYACRLAYFSFLGILPKRHEERVEIAKQEQKIFKELENLLSKLEKLNKV